MPDISSASFSETDASNNGASPNGAPEGMAPSGVNDTIRAIMGGVRRWRDHVEPTVTSAGSANAQTLTYAVAPAAYIDGDEYTFIPGFSNTASMTLNVNGLDALPVVSLDGNGLNGNELRVGEPVTVNVDLANSRFRLRDRGRAALALTGYLQTPGGLILQWGSASFVASSSDTASFAISFPGGIFATFCSPVGAAGSTFGAYVGTVTNSQITINLSSPLTATVYWLVIGH